MGVKHLWTVLAPFCDRKPLYELQGKTVAVDLSCWICEAQNIAEYQVQPRMYLRNLYFRTCYLLLMGVSPVFVLEGKAPELKYDTISARNAIQFKGAKPKTVGVKTGKDRTRFHFILKQCEEMLGYMGIACIKGNGEAESLCAYLNEDGLVDGCISQDSDCFAYGAQVVYRNFSISTQGTQSASGGAVDVYDIRKAHQSLNFGRNKIVAMALLIGSDYSEGVHGVGKDSVMKFFETVSNDEVLDRLRSWRKNVNIFEDYEKQLNDRNMCTSCGHTGKIQSHTKNGCVSCNTTKGCDPFKYRNERLNIKNEVNMRKKALEDSNFPDESLIKEFLDRKDNVKHLDLTWKQPNVVKFLNFTTKFLQWEELYAFEKILPVLTRWQCKNPKLLEKPEQLKGYLKPERIKKIRNPKGVASYEIIWSDPTDCFKGLIPDSQILNNNVDMEKLWSTIEPQNLVEEAYPDLVEAFKQSKIKPKKASKRKKNKENVEDLGERVANVSVSEPKVKKPRKPRVPKGQKTIEPFVNLDINTDKFANENIDELDISLKRLSINTCESTAQTDRETKFVNDELINRQKIDSKIKAKTSETLIKKAMTNSYNQKGRVARKNKTDQITKISTPIKAPKQDLSFDPDLSAFGDENDLDLSDIIDDIISKKSVAQDLKRIAEKYVNNIDDICLKGTVEDEKENLCDNLNTSSFFLKNPADVDDIFEKTFNETFRNFESSSDSEGDDYEINDKRQIVGNSSEQVVNKEPSRKKLGDDNIVCVSSEDEDSFCDENYVPLYERLLKK